MARRLPKCRQVEMAAHPREQQRSDVQLQSEFARQNKRAQLTRRRKFEFDAVVQSLSTVVRNRIDEERMYPVGQSRRAGRVAAKVVHCARNETRFLEKFTAAAVYGCLVFVRHAGRQLPSEAFKCRSKLTHDRDHPIRRARDDGDVILLTDGMVGFGVGTGLKFDLAFDNCLLYTSPSPRD